jgi:hypothetical protein
MPKTVRTFISFDKYMRTQNTTFVITKNDLDSRLNLYYKIIKMDMNKPDNLILSCTYITDIL